MRIHKQPQPQQHHAPAAAGGGKGGAHGAHGAAGNKVGQGDMMAKMARLRAQQDAEEERKRRKKRRGLFAWLDEAFDPSDEERASYDKLTGRNQSTDLEDSFEAE